MIPALNPAVGGNDPLPDNAPNVGKMTRALGIISSQLNDQTATSMAIKTLAPEFEKPFHPDTFETLMKSQFQGTPLRQVLRGAVQGQAQQTLMTSLLESIKGPSASRWVQALLHEIAPSPAATPETSTVPPAPKPAIELSTTGLLQKGLVTTLLNDEPLDLSKIVRRNDFNAILSKGSAILDLPLKGSLTLRGLLSQQPVQKREALSKALMEQVIESDKTLSQSDGLSGLARLCSGIQTPNAPLTNDQKDQMTAFLDKAFKFLIIQTPPGPPLAEGKLSALRWERYHKLDNNAPFKAGLDKILAHPNMAQYFAIPAKHHGIHPLLETHTPLGLRIPQVHHRSRQYLADQLKASERRLRQSPEHDGKDWSGFHQFVKDLEFANTTAQFGQGYHARPEAPTIPKPYTLTDLKRPGSEREPRSEYAAMKDYRPAPTPKPSPKSSPGVWGWLKKAFGG